MAFAGGYIKVGGKDEWAFQITEQAEQVSEARKRLHKERGNAETSAGDSA